MSVALSRRRWRRRRSSRRRKSEVKRKVERQGAKVETVSERIV